MDFWQFATQNSAALLGLIGVLIGSAIAAIVALVTQARQREWNVELQRMDARRRRKEEQLERLVSWFHEWLRTATRLRYLEDELQASKLPKRIALLLKSRDLADTIEKQANRLRDLTAVSQPIAYALLDDELTRLYDEFSSLILGYRDVIQSGDLDEAIIANSRIVSEAKELTSQFQIRADALIDEVMRA